MTPSKTPDVDGLVVRDAADLLCEHGVGGLAVTAIAAIALVAIVPDALSRQGLMAWLGVMMIVLLARMIDLIDSRRRRAPADWSGTAEIHRFGYGVLAGAVVWAAYPLLFFHQLDQTERTTMAIILAAMAGGSATVLAAELPIAIVYNAALLLPPSIMFAVTPGRDNAIVGALGMIFFFVMAAASKVTHRATLGAIRLNRANQSLLVEMARERERTERANARLTTAQIALSETLETLEDRIAERTADLEREIHERERVGHALAKLASTDSLTGMCNRATLATRLEARLAADAGALGSFAVLFIDLDKFKEVNDVKGHFAGDHVLRAVAERIVALVPPDAICARWGGDEFVVIVGAAGVAEAHAVGARIQRSIAQPIVAGLESVRVDATIGIAMHPRHGRTPDELVRAADVAMYAAKESGRGCVRVFEPAFAAALANRHQLEQALRDAIPAQALRLEFQPIVAAHTRQCIAFEALLRWNHPQRGPIGPDEFIPLAERSGDIIRIGRWVLAQACSAAAGWSGAPAPAVSVNVSVAQILGGSVLADVHDALAGSGLSAQRLHIEITESVFARDYDQILPTLVALRRLGVRISLDDFGTGFSSMAHLRLLPLDVIKIDQSFVRTMEGESGPIISAIRSLGKAFDIELVAEGVETAKQAALLSAMDVQYLQGFWISRPLAAGAVSDWLARECEGETERGARAVAALPSL